MPDTVVEPPLLKPPHTRADAELNRQMRLDAKALSCVLIETADAFVLITTWPDPPDV